MSLLDAKTHLFDGADYVPERDNGRLEGQRKKIFELMSDQQWRTLKDIQTKLGYPEASISAQLRHLRKARFGNHIVNRMYLGQGLYAYQLMPPRATRDLETEKSNG